MNRNNIEKITDDADERILLAKLYDKVNAGVQRNILTHTGFLSSRQIQLSRYLFGEQDELIYFGGYPDAERKMLIYLPPYYSQDDLLEDDSPVCRIQATFYKDETPNHRDFLGALMGCGISRECVGDICIGQGECSIFVTGDIAPYLLQNLQSAGRTALKLSKESLQSFTAPEQKFSVIKDTVSSLRLDSVIHAGFRIGRSDASNYISSANVAIDGSICQKADKTLSVGCKISVRGLGKIQLVEIGQTTKKGRIPVTIHRFE